MIIALACAALAVPASAAPRLAAPDARARRTLAAAIKAYERLDLLEALGQFDAAMERFPSWKTAAGHRAACRATLNNSTGAKSDALMAAKLNPDDALSYAARGQARLVLKDYDGALADFTQADRAAASSVLGPLGEGSVLSAQAQLTEALKYLDEAVARDAGCAAALLMRGSVKDRLRDFRGAAADYAAVAAVNPRFSWAYFYQAKALRELKDYRASEAALGTFLEVNPEHQDALYTRGNVRYLLGDYAGCIADLTKLISLDPRRGLAYVNRGQARAAMGDRMGALSDLRKALEIDSSHRDKIQSAIDALNSPDAVAPPAPPASPKTEDVRTSSSKDSPPAERNTGAEETQFIQ